MKRFAAFLAVLTLLLVQIAPIYVRLAFATAFVASVTGNTNNSATWGGAGTPTSSDTCTINPDVVITVPASTTFSCGATTFTAGSAAQTQIAVNGTWSWGGNVTLANKVTVTAGSDAIIDFNGHNLIAGAGGDTIHLTLTGTSGHPIVVQSTGSRGGIPDTGANRIAAMQYVNFSGMTTSYWARSGSLAVTQSYDHITVTDHLGVFGLESTASNAGACFSLTNSDFRNAADANPVSAGAYQPYANYSTAPSSSNCRVMQNVTFDQTTGTLDGLTFLPVKGLQVSNIVIRNWAFEPSDPSITISSIYADNVRNNDVGLFQQPMSFAVVCDSYFYYTSFGHVTGPSGLTFPFEWCRNLTDTTGGLVSDTIQSETIVISTTGNVINGKTQTIHHNIVFGRGALFATVGNAAATPTLLSVYSNTVNLSDDGTTGGGEPFPTGVSDEATNTIANWFVYKNLVTSWNGVGQDPFYWIAPGLAHPPQLTVGDCNAGWPVKPIYYNTGPYGFTYGTNDKLANPLYTDSSRTVATWASTVLGVAGTVAAAETEMLKMNQAGFNPLATPANLVAWVSAGYVPRAAALVSSACAGFIGAMEPVIPTYVPTTVPF